MAGGDSSAQALPQTPTWTVALVCAMFISVSWFLERSLHALGRFLARRKKKALRHALDKLKDELMLLGFISLLITVFATYIADICVNPSLYNDRFLPCKKESSSSSTTSHDLVTRNLQDLHVDRTRRQLEGLQTSSCFSKGKQPLVSFLTLEQLHRFLFMLGAVHVIYTLIAMVLAKRRVHGWKKWELQALEESQRPAKPGTVPRQATFVRHRISSYQSRSRVLMWMSCFFRQFGRSVTRADYLALRSGFTAKHHTGPTFNFQSYVIRSMEDDFQHITGISIALWVFVVLFILFNVHGVNLYFWLSFIPLILVIITGAKLQRVIAQFALENVGLSDPLTGAHVEPRDSLFWLRSPKLMLRLIHFVVFQNAFELAAFFWALWQFGWHSCLLADRGLLYARLACGVISQLLCSYSTLPVYALVTQMGSNYKAAIFDDDVQARLKALKQRAKERSKQSQAAQSSPGTYVEERELHEMEQKLSEEPLSSKSSVNRDSAEVVAKDFV